MRPRLVAFVLAAALAAAATGCGSDDGGDSRTGPGQSLNLTLRVEDGKGKVARAALACADGGGAHGSGFLSADADRHCADALRMQELLTTQPPKDRVCTQVYGGPQTAHIAGTLGGETVARDLSRTNGCEIADWKSAGPLLAPSGIRPGGP